MRVSHGGISLSDLTSCSYTKYNVLVKAAEIEEIQGRLTLIRDINAAFNCDTKYTESLMTRLKALTGYLEISNTPDKNWKERLLKYKR